MSPKKVTQPRLYDDDDGPRCPRCRHALAPSDFDPETHAFICPRCAQTFPPEDAR